MSKDDSFHQYVVEEVFEGFDGITSRAMFGGWGIYKDGFFFALIAEGALYFKVDETNQKDFERMDSKPFIYSGHKGKKVTMSHWELPAEIMEDKTALGKCVEKSVNAAMRSKKK